MSEKVSLASVDLGRHGCSNVFGENKFMRGQTNTSLMFIHWFHLGYVTITMERPFLNRSVPEAQRW